jgi:hypothetical protein
MPSIFIISRSIRLLVLLSQLVAFSSAGAAAAVEPGSKASICTGRWPIDASADGDLKSGDRLFRRQQFRLAAVAYYQVLFCGRLTIIYPAILDHHSLVDACKAALVLAHDGKFAAAAYRLRRIKSQLPSFTEAGTFAGGFYWAAGDRVSAREVWRQTIEGPNFPLPEDQPDAGQMSAKQMLAWTTSKG